MSTESIRPLTRSDVPSAREVLGRAFADNPAYMALFGFMETSARHRAVAAMNGGFADAAVRFQHAEGIERDGALAAIALWAAPGEYPISLAGKALHALPAIPTGVRGIVNLLRMDAALTQRHIRETHYYLWVLGVDPSAQGRGYGSKMLERLNALGDIAHLPWYLETDKESSVRLYSRHGYEVLEEFTMPKVNDARMWAMHRKPR